MAIEDNRIFNSNAEEIFLLQSMDGGGSGGGGGFNGKYIAINSALNQVNGFNSLSIGKDNISATARTFTFGKNNLNLFENTLILGDKNKAVETKIYYNSYYQDNPYGDVGGKIINGKNNTLYDLNTASGVIINGENIEGSVSSFKVDVYVSAAGTEYHDYTEYYERIGMGQYERAYPTSSTYQDYYIQQKNTIPLDNEHVYYGYFDTEGNYIFYKDTTFTEAWDLTKVDDTVILFDINTDTKAEAIPYANIYYYYQNEYYNMPYASSQDSNVSNTIMNGSNIKNNVSPSGSIISGSNIRNNGNTHESLISGYNIENNSIYHGIIGGSNIQNNSSIGTSLVCGEEIENLASIQESIITGRDIKGYSGYGKNNGSIYYSALSGYGIKIYGASINYSSIGGNSHSIQGEVNYSSIHGSYLTLTGSNNYSIIGGYNHELKTTSYSLVSGYNNIINSQCYFSIIGGNYNHLFNPSYSLISGYNHTIDGSYNIIGGTDIKNKGSYNVIGGYGNQPNFGNYNIIAGYNNKSTSTINLNDYYKYDNETHKYIKIYNGSIATSLNNDDYVEYHNESDYSTKVYKVIDSDYTTPYDSTYFNAHLAVDWEYSDTYQPGDYVSRYYVYKCIAEATHIDPKEDTQHQYYIQITNENTPYWEPTGTYEQEEYLQENPGQHDQYFYQAITNVPSGFELVDSVDNLSTNYNAIFGDSNIFNGNYNLITGNNNVISGNHVYTFGEGLISSTNDQIVMGKYNVPDANKIFIIGNGSNSNNRLNILTIDRNGGFDLKLHSLNVGDSNTVTGTYYLVSGTGNIASGERGMAIGHNCESTGYGAIALGGGAKARGLNSFATGGGTTASGEQSAAFGGGTTASGSNSAAFGGASVASGYQSFAIGGGSKASGAHSFAGGGASTAAGGQCSFAFGGGNESYGSNAASFGGGSRANGFQAFSAGGGAVSVEQQGIALGQDLIAGQNSVAVGHFTYASVNPPSELYGAMLGDVLGEYQSNKSYTANTSFCTYDNHIYKCIQNTTGDFNLNDWEQVTNSSNSCNFAEGEFTKAIGDHSHAMGLFTTANGSCTFAGGDHSENNGNINFVYGQFLTATGNNQIVFGKYNIDDSTKALILGNGSYDSEHDTITRSNALTIDQNGNQTLAGKLTVGTQPTAANDVATKQYVDTSTSNLEGIVAAQYSATASYTANQDYVIYEDKLQLCNTSIAAGGEAWNAAHWTEIKVADRLESIEGNVSTLQALAVDYQGATSGAAGVHGFVPAAPIADRLKYLRGDGTWSMLELVEMEYGESGAWKKFIDAYNANCIVYCRASSSVDPSSGTKGRKAFMAYVNNETAPTEVEFQYYRSVNAHTASVQGDEVFVYKLTKRSGSSTEGDWTVTKRNAYSKVVAGTNMTSSYSSGQITLSAKTPTLTRPEYNLTAIQDQTNFEIDADYTNEPIDVYVNGIRKKQTDYTIVQGTNMKEVQFNTGLTAGDEVDITYIKLTMV